MLRGRNNENVLHKKEHFFPWEKESIVPAMQHGCRAKPPLVLPARVALSHFSVVKLKPNQFLTIRLLSPSQMVQVKSKPKQSLGYF